MSRHKCIAEFQSRQISDAAGWSPTITQKCPSIQSMHEGLKVRQREYTSAQNVTAQCRRTTKKPDASDNKSQCAVHETHVPFRIPATLLCRTVSDRGVSSLSTTGPLSRTLAPAYHCVCVCMFWEEDCDRSARLCGCSNMRQSESAGFPRLFA